MKTKEIKLAFDVMVYDVESGGDRLVVRKIRRNGGRVTSINYDALERGGWPEVRVAVPDMLTARRVMRAVYGSPTVTPYVVSR